jgi:hypothetical protein
MPWNSFKHIERLKVNTGCFLEAFSGGRKIFKVNMIQLDKIEIFFLFRLIKAVLLELQSRP